MNEPKPGDRVRITYEAVLSSFSADARWAVCRDESLSYIPPDATVEVLEPEWQVGDVVLSADGFCYQRTSTRVWQGFGGGTYPDRTPHRPLTHIARGGRPVTS